MKKPEHRKKPATDAEGNPMMDAEGNPMMMDDEGNMMIMADGDGDVGTNNLIGPTTSKRVK